jgi:tetrahydromethanopterin S-methyltransferase subunit D
LIALVEVFGALLVWLELIVRSAVIYIAVLFFPVALAPTAARATARTVALRPRPG